MCACCKFFILTKFVYCLDDIDFQLVQDVNFELLMLNHFDKCDQKNTYLFCKECFNSINKIKIFKFDLINMINVSFCQNFFIFFSKFPDVDKRDCHYACLFCNINFEISITQF